MKPFWKPSPRTAAPRVEPLGLDCPPAALLEPLMQLDQPAVLESSALHDTQGRYTVLAAKPLCVLTLRDGAIHADGQPLGRGGESL